MSYQMKKCFCSILFAFCLLPNDTKAQMFGQVQPLSAPDLSFEPEMTIGDFDNDGDSDIFIDNSSFDVDYILINSGQNVFTLGDSIASSAGLAGTYDMNGDGVDDILQNSRWLSYLNQAFVERSLPLGSLGVSGFPHDGIADLDNNGFLDLIRFKITSGSMSAIRVLYNDGSGVFGNSMPVTDEIPISFFFPEVITADFDQDGWEDLLIHGRSSFPLDSSRIFYNQNDTAYVEYDLPASFDRLVIDVDNDDDPDIVAVKNGEFVLLNNEAGVFSDQGPIDIPLRTDLEVFDLDNQGHDEILMVGAEDPSISYLQYDETNQWNNRIDLFNDDIISHTVGDVDQDGDLDIVFCERQFGGIYRLFWFENLTNFPISTEEISSRYNSLVLYPNPSAGRLVAQAPEGESLSAIYIYDGKGKLLLEYTEVTGQQLNIDISGWPLGVYGVVAGYASGIMSNQTFVKGQ